MYSLDPPSVTAADAYSAAVGTIQKEVNRAPYFAAAPAVQTRCEAFELLATNGQFDLAVSTDFDVTGLLASAMVELYDNQFIRNRGTDAIRNGIKNAAKNKLCPYCGQGDATELDPMQFT